MERVDRAALHPVNGGPLTRVGCPDGDGGYVIPESLLRETAVLVSLGLALDWSFDQDFLHRNPAVRLIGVDHTVGPWRLALAFVICLVKVPAYALIGDRDKSRKWAVRLKTILSYRRLFAPPIST